MPHENAAGADFFMQLKKCRFIEFRFVKFEERMGEGVYGVDIKAARRFDG
mgnify:CR=1 FL=1